MNVTRETVKSQALQVQIGALIDSWQRQQAERSEMADSMATDGNRGYHQGFADALGSCAQALKLLEDD